MLARVPLMTTTLWRSVVDHLIKSSVTGDIEELLKHREMYNFEWNAGIKTAVGRVYDVICARNSFKIAEVSNVKDGGWLEVNALAFRYKRCTLNEITR